MMMVVMGNVLFVAYSDLVNTNSAAIPFWYILDVSKRVIQKIRWILQYEASYFS